MVYTYFLKHGSHFYVCFSLSVLLFFLGCWGVGGGTLDAIWEEKDDASFFWTQPIGCFREVYSVFVIIIIILGWRGKGFY